MDGDRYIGTRGQAVEDIKNSTGIKSVFISQDSSDVGVQHAVGAALRGFEELKDRGYGLKTVKMIKIQPKPTNHNPLHGIPNADWTYGTNVMGLYTKADQWELGHGTARKGWFTTDTLRGTIQHEFGHAVTYYDISDHSPVMRLTIKKQVSEYAASNKSEFMAEVFAGMMQGKSYSTEIMNYYRELGGRALRPLKANP